MLLDRDFPVLMAWKDVSVLVKEQLDYIVLFKIFFLLFI